MAGAGAILAADLAGSAAAPGSWSERAKAHGGREVTTEDGRHVLAFPGVRAALACAADLQREDAARGRGPLGPRVGIDAGEEGPAAPAARAARLCARAGGGQVLVSGRVHARAVADGSGHEFREAPGDEGEDGGPAWELLWREPGPRTRIRLCGAFSLELDGREVAGAVPAGQPGLLLRYLLSARDHAAERGELIDVAWPGHAPRDPLAALRPVLSRLRRALAPALLEGRDRLQLRLPAPVWADVDEAPRAIEQARAAARAGAWDGAREHAQAALALVRPGFLPGWDGAWVDVRRRELEDLALEALELVARSGLEGEGGDPATTERAAQELIALAPYRETGHRFLMEALARAGNAAEALRVYEALRVLLRDELGATPAPEVQALHQRLLTADAGGGPDPPSPDPPPGGPAPRVPLPRLLSPDERSPLVGREEELDVLRAAWRQARDGSRRLVLVAGEAGIGKSRLAGELAREAHADGTVLHASCQEEALIPYQPFVEALRHHARGAGAGAGWASAAAGARAPELVRLIPELAPAQPDPPAAPEPDDPRTRRYLLFEAVSAVLTEAAARAPLLLVLDDLHWADRGTLQLLRHVVRAPHEAPVLVVGTYREGEVGAEHPLSALLADLRRDRLFERVSLRGLGPVGVAGLIASHAGHEAPSGVVATVHEHTDGNPFFVEEVLRHLIESGVLFEREGRWTSALSPGEIGVPPAVKDVLLRRLGRLSEACRGALSAAAVLGRRSSFDVLHAMAGLDEDALLGALEEALDAQLVVEAPARGGPAYAFSHALVREALYGEISAPRRRRMHARAARALEEVEGPGQVAALAVHLRLAGSAGDDAKAIDLSLRAGGAALELFAWEEAAAHWDGAATVMARAGGREADRARLLVALADLMVVVGDLGRQIAYLEGALAACERLGDLERAARAHSRLGMAHALIDSIDADFLDVPRAFRHFDAARAVLDRGPARKALGHLETGVATALTYGLRMPEGIAAAARGMEIAQELGDELLWAGAAEAYAWHKVAAGDLEEGFSTLQRAFDVADAHQRSFLAWMAANIRGQLTWGLGAPDEAQGWFERPLQLAYVGSTAYRRQIADGIGRCHISRGAAGEARRLVSDARPTWFTHSLEPLLDLWDGRWDEVAAVAARVLATSRRTGNRWDEWAAQHVAARVRVLRGDLAAAGDLLEPALAIVVDGGARYFELWVRPDLARVRAEQGRLEDARAHVDRCAGILAAGEDWRGRAGHAVLAEAVVLAREDRMDEAHAAFASAHATFARHGLPGEMAEALHAWGRALARAGAGADAAGKLDEALALLRRHGAGRAWQERVEADARPLRAGAR